MSLPGKADPSCLRVVKATESVSLLCLCHTDIDSDTQFSQILRVLFEIVIKFSSFFSRKLERNLKEICKKAR